jgi:hypothetical protein
MKFCVSLSLSLHAVCAPTCVGLSVCPYSLSVTSAPLIIFVYDSAYDATHSTCLWVPIDGVAAMLGVALQMVTHFSTVSQHEKPSEIVVSFNWNFSNY